MSFVRATDEELKEAGFDPSGIVEYPEGEAYGPYVAIKIKVECSCCGATTTGYTVLCLETAVGVSRDWANEEAEIEAQEHADELNAAWQQGRKGITTNE